MVKIDEEDSEYYVKYDVNWEEWYMVKERYYGIVREYFLVSFLKYLRYVEGGIFLDKESSIYVR